MSLLCGSQLRGLRPCDPHVKEKTKPSLKGKIKLDFLTSPSTKKVKDVPEQKVKDVLKLDN